MKNFKWGTESFNENPIYVVLFVSRNKDNKNIENFKERRESFITHEPMGSEKLKNRFKEFVNRGQKGEFSRMYYSVNARDGVKIHKYLLHFLIENPEFNLCSIQPKLAGIAAMKEHAAEKKWMFDFDSIDMRKLYEFRADILNMENAPTVDVYKTPHGYAIITNRGFDSRKLMEKWKDIATLKRDDLLCVDWDYKE